MQRKGGDLWLISSQKFNLVVCCAYILDMNELLIIIIEVEKVLGEINETHYEPLWDEREELTRRDFMLLMRC